MLLKLTSGILSGTLWTFKEINEKTRYNAGKLMLLPIFFFRMITWTIILIVLGSFSIGTFISFIVVNSILLLFIQDQLILEPVYFACLSLVFSIHRMPSTEREASLTTSDKDNEELNEQKNSESIKILFWMVLTGL